MEGSHRQTGIQSSTETLNLQMVILSMSFGRWVSLTLIVLISSNTRGTVFVKLGDFGLSTIMDSDSAPSTYAGTPQYMPLVGSDVLYELPTSRLQQEQQLKLFLRK